MPNKSSPAFDAADDPAVHLGRERVTSRARSGVAARRCSHSAAFVDHHRVRGVEERHDLLRVAVWLDRPDGHTRHVLAAILTIGNELVAGDTENTNASWLARRLETLGVKVVISAAVPDEIERIVDFVRRERARVDHLLVTGGLGGTPDDITREAFAAAFDVPQEVVAGACRRPALSASSGDPEYAARWAALPAGARPLDNPLGGAPGFLIENTWVLPGLPSEMKAMFDLLRRRVRAPTVRSRPGGAATRPASRRSRRRSRRRRPAGPLSASARIRASSAAGPEVEVVLKSADPAALGAAKSWLEARARPPHLTATVE